MTVNAKTEIVESCMRWDKTSLHISVVESWIMILFGNATIAAFPKLP